MLCLPKERTVVPKSDLTYHKIATSNQAKILVFWAIREQHRLHLAITKAGLPIMKFHELRHAAASLLISVGVHPKIVQEPLGHSTVSITIDIYSHALPSLQEEAINRLNTLLSKQA